MSPNLEDQMPNSPEIEPQNDQIQLTLTPLSDTSASTSISDGNQSVDSESNEEESIDELADVVVNTDLKNFVALEHNIRELLIRVSNTEHLETVTQIKLRVIASELALQQLGCYLPALRELTLDGSIVSSLRDLGYGLRNLKILRVNRCQLTCIDGVLGFEYLEELYAADNSINDLSPCAFLSNLKVIDVRRNFIRAIGSLSFLNLCPDLAHLLLDGNAVTKMLTIRYRSVVGRILRHLVLLNGEPLVRGLNTDLVEEIEIEDLDEPGASTEESPNVDVPERTTFTAARLARSNTRNPEESSGFTVRFPPKVCGNNGKSS